MTVGELNQRMSMDEFRKWMLLERYYPLPDSWMQTGILASTLANVMGAKKIGGWKPQDFIPNLKIVRSPQTEDECLKKLDSILSLQNL